MSLFEYKIRFLNKALKVFHNVMLDMGINGYFSGLSSNGFSDMCAISYYLNDSYPYLLGPETEIRRLARSLISCSPLATRRKTSSRVVTLTP
mmetsp:Transcript_22611/g.10898  ORF Transcript_22611/g.10898 Transcript_22611/m.10898 type:complete len:92 (+) Transcript_22611:2514-2789(+)